MSRTPSFTSMRNALLALCLVFTASQVFAALPARRTGGQITPVATPVAQAGSGLPNQLPAVEPPAGPASDHGVYAVQDQVESLIGSGPFRDDPLRASAFDNFTLDDAYDLTGICWVGIYSEPIPEFDDQNPGANTNNPSDTDFIVAIFGDTGSGPDLNNLILSWTLEGGDDPGTSGADMTVTYNGDISPTTATTTGGGPGFDYEADISGTLGPGNYWISIIADQTFANPEPIFDPEWQWHIGTGPGDGFFFEDLATGLELALRDSTDGKDLAFQLKGRLVPEPGSAVLAMLGLIVVTMLRRKR